MGSPPVTTLFGPCPFGVGSRSATHRVGKPSSTAADDDDRQGRGRRRRPTAEAGRQLRRAAGQRHRGDHGAGDGGGAGRHGQPADPAAALAGRQRALGHVVQLRVLRDPVQEDLEPGHTNASGISCTSDASSGESSRIRRNAWWVWLLTVPGEQTEHLRGVLRRQVLEEPQHDHRPLLVREAPQGVLEHHPPYRVVGLVVAAADVGQLRGGALGPQVTAAPPGRDVLVVEDPAGVRDRVAGRGDPRPRRGQPDQRVLQQVLGRVVVAGEQVGDPGQVRQPAVREGPEPVVVHRSPV